MRKKKETKPAGLTFDQLVQQAKKDINYTPAQFEAWQHFRCIQRHLRPRQGNDLMRTPDELIVLP